MQADVKVLNNRMVFRKDQTMIYVVLTAEILWKAIALDSISLRRVPERDIHVSDHSILGNFPQSEF